MRALARFFSAYVSLIEYLLISVFCMPVLGEQAAQGKGKPILRT